jgi:formylmethanofuran dehydrogenase subunit E
MVDLGISMLRKNMEADTIVETKHCLPDAVQLLTPCTVGNGWMKILDWDKFAITFYDRHALDGYRVWLDLEKAKDFPDLYNWYMRLKPKKELSMQVMLDVMFEAGTSVLSSREVRVIDFYQREKKGDTAVCPGCHEAYSTKQGAVCLACSGKAYFQYQQ